MLRFHIPAVDVDGVGKCLEGVEADAERQYADALNGRKTGAEDGIDAAEHEICILEVEEHPETARQRDEQQDETGGLVLLEALKPQAAEVVDEDERQHDREKTYLAPAVEHEAAQEQNGIFEFRGREIVQRQCDGQKAQQKDDGAEDHGVSLLFNIVIKPKKADAATAPARESLFICPERPSRRWSNQKSSRWRQ